MEFDKIIPIVIFIIWAIVAVKKRKKPQKKQPAPLKEKPKQPANQLFGKFQSTIENFLEQLEQQKSVATPKTIPPSSEEDPEYAYQEQPDSQEEMVETVTSINEYEKVPESSLQTSPEHKTQKKHSKKTKKRIEQLKKAVIWSEILAKPVGLREE
jgi:hypothetical protein